MYKHIILLAYREGDTGRVRYSPKIGASVHSFKQHKVHPCSFKNARYIFAHFKDKPLLPTICLYRLTAQEMKKQLKI